MESELTKNAVLDIFNGREVDAPVVQVLGIKKIPSQDESKPERWRLVISDGEYKHQSTMLATQLNTLITSNAIQPHAVVRLSRFLCNLVANRRIVILLAVDVLTHDLGRVIGNPSLLRDDGSVDSERGRNSPSLPPHAAAATAPGEGMGGGGGSLAAEPAFLPHQQTTPLHNGPPAANVVPAAPSRANPYARPGAAATATASSAASANAYTSFAGPRPNGAMFQPITSLNPYNSKWTIRARVTAKSPIRKYQNQRGEGMLFSVDLLDESGEIRATAFNETVTKLYDVMVVGKTYMIRGGRVKPANKKYSPNNDYEMGFDDNTTIEAVEDDAAVPKVKYDFKPFSMLESLQPNSNADVVAVCVEASPVTSITTKTTQKTLSKRELVLVDRSGLSVNCTLWGSEALGFETALPCAVVLKAARVSDFGGRSLSAGPSVLVNPDMPEAIETLAWYESEGKHQQSKKLSVKGGGGGGGNDQRVMLSAVKDAGLGLDGRTDYFATKGVVTFMKKDNCFYKACPECNKKLVEDGDQYRCEKCSKNSPTFQWRLMLSINIADAAGSAWVSAFQESGETLFGMDAQQLGDLKQQNPAAFDAMVRNVTFSTWMWRCRAKEETYNDEKRVKVSVMSVQPVDYRQECSYLISEIKKYL